MKITVPGVPPSMNRFVGRANKWEYRAEKKKWTALVFALCAPRREQPPAHALVRIDYYFPTRIRHDPDNYSGKFLLDGLTAAGMIADDDFLHVSTSFHGHYDKANPRTEITVMPMMQEG